MISYVIPAVEPESIVNRDPIVIPAVEPESILIRVLEFIMGGCLIDSGSSPE